MHEMYPDVYLGFMYKLCSFLLHLSLWSYYYYLFIFILNFTFHVKQYGFIAWLLSTSVGLLLSFLSKSSVLLGLSLTLPLMVACLSIGVPLWIRNGYQFWLSRVGNASHAGNQGILGRKEV
ncbi:calpain-type cysteine protease ADL1-like [Olea europaea var. sylvestris]|uniref:calpain-type cysteine protease ADL1-like n=1 Tax=Olea europaea var. sylvestris TaxID=158386 RepID=UPI000C1D5FB2|nr:calpain-type cysteine protease ADL1-like [Olea europaea var. sylvestris]